MTASPRQLGLFDSPSDPAGADAAPARARMQAMIAELRATDVPPWTDQTGVILRDGAFKRAMYLVPSEEAAALWSEYDAQMERLFAIWAHAKEGT